MKSPEQFYKDEIASLTSKEKALQRKSNIYVACKLILFCCIIASIWYTVGNKGNVPGFISIAISVILYVAALKADAILNRKIRDLQSRRKVCENELSYFRNDFSPFEDGTEFIDPHHKYSYDLDVFGPESLFNRINRTVTLKGKEMLARKLTDLPSDTDIIHKRQKAVKELAALPQWRIKFHSNRHIGKELDRLADVIAKPIQGNRTGQTGRCNSKADTRKSIYERSCSADTLHCNCPVSRRVVNWFCLTDSILFLICASTSYHFLFRKTD